jgi:hypothetical protein
MDKFLILQDVNSSGQGHNPHHHEHPHHDALTKYGWLYSHTTPITCGLSRYAHHTYCFPNTDWRIGIDCRPGLDCQPGFLASASKLGSGRQTRFFEHGLERYLKRKTRELLRMIK